MDPRQLLDQFLGPGGSAKAAEMAKNAGERLAGGLSGAARGFPGGALGGLAAGGLIGLLLGGKKLRKMAGGVVGYGGAAALGALALKAWQTWQENQARTPSAPSASGGATTPAQLARLGADGKPFELAVIQAMIAAANADGHLGAEEKRAIFEQVERFNLDAEGKAFVFDALAQPASIHAIAALANGPEQASELWLASRLAIDPDNPREQAYLHDLARALNLPEGLVEHLEAQLTQQTAPAG